MIEAPITAPASWPAESGAGGYDSGSVCVRDALVIVTDVGLPALGHQATKLEWPTVACTLLPS